MKVVQSRRGNANKEKEMESYCKYLEELTAPMAIMAMMTIPLKYCILTTCFVLVEEC